MCGCIFRSTLLIFRGTPRLGGVVVQPRPDARAVFRVACGSWSFSPCGQASTRGRAGRFSGSACWRDGLELITGALWASIFLVDLLAVAVLYATLAFLLVAGLRLYQDMERSPPSSRRLRRDACCRQPRRCPRSAPKAGSAPEVAAGDASARESPPPAPAIRPLAVCANRSSPPPSYRIAVRVRCARRARHPQARPRGRRAPRDKAPDARCADRRRGPRRPAAPIGRRCRSPRVLFRA